MMDYVVVSRNVIGRLLDVRVLRGEGEGMSDHFLVEGKLRVGTRWVKTRQVGEAEKVLKVNADERKITCIKVKAISMSVLVLVV